MIVWFIFTVMVVVAAVGVTIPLVRRYDAGRAAAPENRALKDQLAEIQDHAASEGASEPMAESLKADVVRRFLADSPTDGAPSRPLSGRGLIAVALGIVGVVAIGGAVLYVNIGRPDMTATSAPPPDSQPADAAGGADGNHVGSMIAQLEAKMRQSPNDPEGWRMLGWSYMATRRFADAAAAYGKAAALNPKDGDYVSARGEALVNAADGRVTPEAEAAFKAAVALDPSDPRARYFLAAVKDQAGDHAGAMADWIALLKSAPPGATWAADVRGFVVRIAASRGEDISAKLPPLPPGVPAAAAAANAPAGGPTPDQVAAAQSMPAGDQQAMIHQMVDGLAARLKSNPKDSDGWVKLMRARMVLGDPAGATAAYHDGMKAFSGQGAVQSMLSDSARQIGVPGV